MLGDVVQLKLFGETPVEEKPKKKLKPKKKHRISKTQYYCAMSAMQKYVRRGMVDDAIRCAKMVAERDTYSLKRRVATIALEDIGLGSWDVVRTQMDKIWGRAPVEDLLAALEAFAGAVKNRDADDGFNMVWWSRSRKWEPAVTLPDPDEYEFLVSHATYMDAPKEEVEQWWEWAEDEAAKRGAPCQAAIEFLKRWRKMVPYHTRHTVMLILARWERTWIRDPVTIMEDPGVKNPPMLGEQEMFPECSFDGHTRYGKIVFGKLEKDNELPESTMHHWTFFMEGARLDRWAAWENDYRSIVGPARFPEISENLRKAIGNVSGLSQWAWRRIAWPDHMREMGDL